MTSFLVTNDDGIDAPALAPLASALSRLGTVTVAVPSGERSWISKAISREGEIEVSRVDRGGIDMWSIGGFPADCVQIGAFGLMDSPPDLVVSGINIGSNKGSAYAACSGTLGAVVEASNVGIGGIAFSAMSVGLWKEWVDWVFTEDAIEMWERLAGVAAGMVEMVLETGLPKEADVISVNLPEGANMTTPRRVTSLARTTYGSLFAGDNGIYRHSYDGVLHSSGDVEGSDLHALDSGLISITPIRYANTAPLGDSLRRRWES